jgi:hypothetical protein
MTSSKAHKVLNKIRWNRIRKRSTLCFKTKFSFSPLRWMSSTCQKKKSDSSDSTYISSFSSIERGIIRTSRYTCQKVYRSHKNQAIVCCPTNRAGVIGGRNFFIRKESPTPSFPSQDNLGLHLSL